MAFMYSHAIGAMALCEAYGLSQDPRLKRPAREPAKRRATFFVGLGGLDLPVLRGELEIVELGSRVVVAVGRGAQRARRLRRLKRAQPGQPAAQRTAVRGLGR